ncbi:hypothetical protein B0H16DRAFT_1363924 [Mycena metata]|uniref:F-box domain-containing protein n=1 Tax=Mycena metata TaxID=1033252 RepID=A0AAD7JVB8_9AGAR|nr:hypothetical protein B0H16DRAFT_1363924 [Mycena metata]
MKPSRRVSLPMPPWPPGVLRQRVSDLEADILHHEYVLQDLKEQRSAVLSDLNLVTYPVLTLPLGITAEIFKRCIEPGRPYSAWAPLVLTRICHQWRVLAFATPALWDTIDEIEFDDGFAAPRHPQPETFISTWFSRAGTRPLSLGIMCPDTLHSVSLELIILQHASRFQHLDVLADVKSLYDFNPVQPFPILSDLALRCLRDPDDREGRIQLFDIHTAPALRRLCLENLLPSMVIMPWAQLTKMSLVLIPLWECLDALRWATSLREFHRNSPPEEEGQLVPEQRSPVNHSSLVSLTISADGDEDILPLLTLACLQRFELGGCFGKYLEYLDGDVVPFLSRVSATLRTLKVGMSPTVPIQSLQPLTQLTTLELVRSVHLPFNTDIISALDRRSSPDFLPRLQTFVVSECGSDQVDDELLDTLGSRCDATDAAHGRLESFSLIWPTFEYSSAVPKARLPLVNVLPLRALAGRGMRIHIGTRDQNSFY